MQKREKFFGPFTSVFIPRAQTRLTATHPNQTRWLRPRQWIAWLWSCCPVACGRRRPAGSFLEGRSAGRGCGQRPGPGGSTSAQRRSGVNTRRKSWPVGAPARVIFMHLQLGLKKSSSSTSWLGLAAARLGSDRLDAQNEPEPSLFL
jgi:hypothetical protein